ncbi:MAG TPA: ASKHA domain-containing protein [Syntrophomonadaceae bacterium]|nr:ASKHA domain-containing protein [Syntrophomonadaceae bacterium]
MSEQVKIQVIGPDKAETSVWAIKGQNLREALVLSGYDPGGTCGGRGTCGKCKVRLEGQVDPLGPEERARLLPEEVKAGERLACFCSVKGPLTASIDYNVLAPGYKIGPRWPGKRMAGQEVQTRSIFIPGLDKQNPLPLFDRLVDALPGFQIKIPPENLQALAAIDRQGRPALELQALVFEGREVRYISRETESAYGVALDLGTTSLQAILVDLARAEVVAIASHTNLQRVFGQDIISRISYCLENQEGLENLHRILINSVNDMVAELTSQAGISPYNLFSFSAVGNPVMLHFFLNLSPNGFAALPYCGLFGRDFLTTAAALSIDANPEAALWVLPQVGGFVGADTVAGLLTIPHLADLRFLFIDIGTNGEVVVGNRGKLWASSAAAGPAFEGGGITRGMRATPGAIDRIRWNQEGQLSYHVLGNMEPRGLCGSGIIDLTACLLEGECLNPEGNFSEQAWEKLAMRSRSRGAELVLDSGHSDLVFDQEDVRQVQLAKSAIRTAIEVLLNRAGLTSRDLDAVFLAGAFGSYIDPEQAVRIGLLPALDLSKICNLGNAAAEGAVMALLSPANREDAGKIARNVQHVELAAQAEFQDLFLSNLNF